MFQALTRRFTDILGGITRKKITEGNIRDTLREIRVALLEADVAFDVVKEFLEKVEKEALGERVLKGVNPAQQFISVVYEEMAKLMGPVDDHIRFQKGVPTVVLLAGLQGSGKTTTCGKLALLLKTELRRRPLLVAADIQRPAAIDQLATLAKSLGVEIFPSDPSQKPVEIARSALDWARRHFYDVLIVDTAGRLAIDEAMMAEVRAILAAGGFSTDHLGRVFEVLPALARHFEVFAQRRTAVTLLKTYLGHRTGERVLAGQVKHGDGEHIHSVIWFSDLRGSTTLSKSMPQDAYLALLNRYFDCLAGAVIKTGGEVLRFIGDAVLAIFPISGTDSREACLRAIEAAKLACQCVEEGNRARPGETPVRFGIGLHLGDVTYGNIGVRDRLEFTVIGASANEAARVESMCKTLGRSVVISSAFAAAYPGQLASLGRHELKDVEGSQELFTLP